MDLLQTVFNVCDFCETNPAVTWVNLGIAAGQVGPVISGVLTRYRRGHMGRQFITESRLQPWNDLRVAILAPLLSIALAIRKGSCWVPGFWRYLPQGGKGQ